MTRKVKRQNQNNTAKPNEGIQPPSMLSTISTTLESRMVMRLEKSSPPQP